MESNLQKLSKKFLGSNLQKLSKNFLKLKKLKIKKNKKASQVKKKKKTKKEMCLIAARIPSCPPRPGVPSALVPVCWDMGEDSAENQGLASDHPAWVPALLQVILSVASSKSLPFSDPLFPHLQREVHEGRPSQTYLTIKEIQVYGDHNRGPSTWYPHHTHSINVCTIIIIH